MGIRFDASKEDFAVIERIAARAVKMANGGGWHYPERDAQMDLTACHRNGTPLLLTDLLASDDFNFGHDVFGIRRHLDRTTGKLLSHFQPRFAKAEKREDDETNPELEARSDGHDTRHYEPVEGGA